MACGQMTNNWSNSFEVLLNQSFPVHRACRDGDVEQLTKLLECGEHDLYEEDDFYGWTPIHWAAYFGKLQCLIVLVESGVCCDAPTERLNQTPAHIAAYGGYSHCLKWLLQSGAMISKQLNCLRKLINIQAVGNNCDLASSKFSQSPTHLCAYAGHPQCLFWLLKAKASVDLQDYMGETAIHKAARTGSMECVSLLVSQGARLSIKNYSGNTASQVATTAGFTECAQYLEQAMQLQTGAGKVHMNSVREGPEGQANTHAHCVSMDTYSNPQMSNGFTHSNQTMPNTCMNNNNNNCSDDCDMEMEDAVPNGESAVSNGCGLPVAMKEVPNGDVLLNEGVQRNLVPLAGKKRGREETEIECFKRPRNDDSCQDKARLKGWFLNNGHMTSESTDHMTQTSDSLVEHITSVTMQQGYDSMILDSMGDES